MKCPHCGKTIRLSKGEQEFMKFGKMLTDFINEAYGVKDKRKVRKAKSKKSRGVK